ncbi:MAG: hypothetical protein KDK78_08395 [Chlamydiia bacterium]|nr:hypothetical protein [Chlamydiia bacterium]
MSPHRESREAVDELVQPMCLAGTYESHTITHSSGTRTGDALELLSKLGIKGRVTLITDPAFVEKDRARAVQALGEDRFNGCVSVPMTDWRCEMRLHGYDEKSLGSAEKATIAWAQSAWNFKAREMNFEWKNFQAS